MSEDRIITTAEAIREATAQAMEADDRVIVLGEGVPDPKGIFGTTSGLREQFGAQRVFDMPVAENGMTGVAIGAAISGMRPILTHQRVDFALYSMDQIVNNAAKWQFMFGEQASVPIVIRMVVGRGWGQGAQHSQSLEAMFAHIPGLHVVVPATPYDAKGLLMCAIQEDIPVVMIEHRWIHSIRDHVPQNPYTIPLGHADIKRKGSDVTVVSSSYMTIESIRAVDVLDRAGISAEVVDVRTLRPLDTESIIRSARKTGRLIAVDGGWQTGGFAGEIVARVVDAAWEQLKTPPVRVALPDEPSGSSLALTEHYYKTWEDIVRAAGTAMHVSQKTIEEAITQEKSTITTLHDVPDMSFTGPF